MSIALADLSDWDSLMPADADISPQHAAVEVRTIFRGVPVGERLLSRAPDRGGGRRPSRSSFMIGCDARVDAAVAAGFVPWSSHPLVMAAGDGYVVNVTPHMRGRVRVRGQVQALAAFVRENGSTFALPASGAAQLDCGAITFIVGRTGVARPLPAKPWRWSWSRDASTLAGAVAVGLMALVVMFLPPDPGAISLDLLDRDHHMLSTLIKPPAVLQPPAPSAALGPAAASKPKPAGRAAPPSTAVAGATGDPTAPVRATRPAVAMADNVRARTDPQLAKASAVAAIQNAGVLGVLKAASGAQVASIFGGDRALGPDAENVLGNMTGPPLAGAFGQNGFGVEGTGSQQAGTGDKLIGTSGGLDISGLLGDGGPGGYADHLARLPSRRATVLPWIRQETHVRGALDKEIVRRVVRLHLNEIRYCYEQELVRVPQLSGRLVVQFTIAPAGQVIAAFLQSSTLANARVENCAVQAVRRWPFPKPEGGGLVTVSYPFVLTPSGGG
ncbi:MAG: TonB family protein [Myxococcales bacterium]